MAKHCPVTKKSARSAGGYSNRTRATQFNPTGTRRLQPNMQKKRIYVPELKKTVIINVSSKGLKTINKRGVFATLKKAGVL